MAIRLPHRQARCLIACLAVLCAIQITPARADAIGGPIWARVLRSPLIVVGTLQVPKNILLSTTPGVPPVPVGVSLSDMQFLKGKPPEPFTGFLWDTSATGSGGIAVQDLYALDGKQVIAFLAYAGDTQGHAGYLVDTTESTNVIPFDAVALDAIKTEVRRQATLDDAVHAYMDAHYLHGQFTTGLLVMLLGHVFTADFAQARLAGRDCSYVPTLVKLMDDRSPVALDEMEAPKRGLDSYPAYAHYTPQEVVDALSVILTGIVGAPLGDIHDGGTEFRRQQAVSAWRTYVGLFFSNQDTDAFGKFALTDPSPNACKGLP